MFIVNNEKVFYDESEGQTIIIDFETGIYYSFDKISSAVLKDLAAGAEPEAIIKGLRALPDCPVDIEDRLWGFVNQLTDLAIMVETEEKSNMAPSEYSPEDAQDGYDFIMEGFEEIADLLLMDPIHEINTDVGWPVKKSED